MDRTLENMVKQLKLTEEAIKPLAEKAKKLRRDIEQYKLDNALFHPMSDLIHYAGREIRSIELVERCEDGTLDTDYKFLDEIFRVDEDGRLYYSSWDYGIIEYDDNAHQYVHMYHGYPTYYDYIGFTEIELND